LRILIVEDEVKVADSLKKGLEEKGYEVKVAYTGEDGFFLVNSERFDLMILDIMLPGRSGIEILKVVRGKGEKLPVLLLTARDEVEDRVEGLDAGADDYLVKPFAFVELLARIRALLRRTANEVVTSLSLGDLELDVLTRTVTRAGKKIELTPLEYRLLEYLLRNRNHVVAREMLARDVWEETARSTSMDNVIDVMIARLRKKIDSGYSVKLLHTVRGVGFILREGGDS